MKTEDILKVMSLVHETFDEEISTSASETVFGIESWIDGKDKFFENLEEKLKLLNITSVEKKMVLAPLVWGLNIFDQEIKEHDKLLCGIGRDTWFTHVMFDTERKCWHRGDDYYYGKVVGSYDGY